MGGRLEQRVDCGQERGHHDTTGYEPGSTARAVTNAAYSYDHPGYDWITYPERLTAAGVSWQIHQEWDNFTDNAVEYFLPFKRIGQKILSQVDGPFAPRRSSPSRCST